MAKGETTTRLELDADHLIARFEKKIQATIARIWGESEPDTAKA